MLHDYVRACFQLSEGNVPGRFVIAAAGPCYLAIGSSRYRRLATIYPPSPIRPLLIARLMPGVLFIQPAARWVWRREEGGVNQRRENRVAWR